MSDAVRETLDHTSAALKAGGSVALCGVVSDDIEIQSPAPDGLMPLPEDWLEFERYQAFIATVVDHLVIDTVEPLAIHVADDTLMAASLASGWSGRDRAGCVSKRSPCSHNATITPSGTRTPSAKSAPGTGSGRRAA